MSHDDLDDAYLIDQICTITHFKKDDRGLFNFALLAIRSRASDLELSVYDYLQHVKANEAEYKYFLNQVTIHKTGWFREKNHFELITQYLRGGEFKNRLLRVMVGACSTGEEAYSLSLLLQDLKRQGVIRDYTITAFDIDPVSVDRAVDGVYHRDHLMAIPAVYEPYVLIGEDEYADFFTLDESVKRPCQFLSLNLLELDQILGQFDLVMVRNVFIYFDDLTTLKIARLIEAKLSERGLFIAGVSEKHDAFGKLFDIYGSTVYQKKAQVKVSAPKKVRSKILVLDDSKVIHEKIKKLTEPLSYDLLHAYTAAEATLLLAQHGPNLLVVDVNLPDTNGIDWIVECRQRGTQTPALVLSDVKYDEIVKMSQSRGFNLVDFIPKSTLLDDPRTLIEVISACLGVKNMNDKLALAPSALFVPDVILLGASTGGIAAIHKALKGLGPALPPLLLVQHLDAKFADEFSRGIEKVSGLKPGDLSVPLKPGHFYISRAVEHLELRRVRDQYFAFQNPTPPAFVTHKPSVDHLFRSAVPYAKYCWSILLTGMGDDGARAMLELHQARALTLTQDSASALVYGMPKQAKLLGATTGDVTPEELNQLLVDLAQGKLKKAS